MESRHRVAQQLLTKERHVKLVHERGVQHARSREIRRLRPLWYLRAGHIRALHLGRPGAGVRRISRRYPPAVRSLGRTYLDDPSLITCVDIVTRECTLVNIH